jgi:hypothetical protein
MRRTKTKGPPWTCSASFSARLSVAPWLRSSPQSCCSPWRRRTQGILDDPLHLGGAACVGGRGLSTMSSAPHHHVTLVPPHEGPLLGLGGVRGPAGPLIPPGRRRVVRDLHHLRPKIAGGRSRLRRLRRHLHLRLRGHGRPSWRRGRHLWSYHRIHGRPRRLRPLHLLHSGSLRGLRLHYGRRRGLRLHDDWCRPPLGDLRLRRGGLI